MSTISNNVLEKLSVRYRLLAKIHDGSESQAWEESALIVEELLALRKEREKAEPVSPVVKHINDPYADPDFDEPAKAAPPAPTDKPKSEMSQQAERLLRDTTALAEKLSAEADTTPQQFESLAFKSVVPEGWKLVPAQPTQAMCDSVLGMACFTFNGDGAKRIYEAMLSAAPEQCK
ncbi:hypothetical protein G4U59_04270 [Cronobacter sakazakii]|uniref:hypothetical protein n=1 Tax=Cronobacter sakazakii TaxID=28141 RepID=UPI001C0AD1E8|nr:hypothetical protein [Cronobacter sakazakii]QWR92219.1 hypothetical protein G4U59_04270 [Cronobacter sakazakii]